MECFQFAFCISYVLLCFKYQRVSKATGIKTKFALNVEIRGEVGEISRSIIGVRPRTKPLI